MLIDLTREIYVPSDRMLCFASEKPLKLKMHFGCSVRLTTDPNFCFSVDRDRDLAKVDRAIKSDSKYHEISDCTQSKLTISIARTQVKPYAFKKHKPQPGAYPKNFSPYTLSNTAGTRAVSLTRSDIRNDLLQIEQGMIKEFSSTYFEESSSASDVQNHAVEVIVFKPPSQKKERLSRRRTFSTIQAPTSEAEERRQIKAAIKASQLEREERPLGKLDTAFESNHSSCALDSLSGPGKRFATRKEDVTVGPVVLRHVCSGKICRTG